MLRNCTKKEETWMDVIGYKGYYQVSNRGGIKSLPRTVPMCDGRTYSVAGKILRPSLKSNGYFEVVLSKDGNEQTRLLHRLILETFVGSCPEGMECRHLDGNPANNRLTNLCWGTCKEQYEDRKKHGTTSKGRVGNSHKLKGKTDEIVKLSATGDYTKAQLARKFNVVPGTIYYTLATKRRGRS